MSSTSKDIRSMEKQDYSRPKKSSPPPEYAADPSNLTAAFSDLDLGNSGLMPTADQGLAHLKLLEAFHQLREDVATSDGLFGIRDDFVPSSADEQQHAQVLLSIREKRWAVYVAKAAKRFERWWQVCVQPGAKMLRQSDMAASDWSGMDIGDKQALNFDRDTLPPLDVMMVWHAYMLNPRDFLEDCMRSGKIRFWRSGLPWAAINSSIGNESLEYIASDKARQSFESKTGFAWDSLHDSPSTIIGCPGCRKEISTLWTSSTAASYYSTKDAKVGTGFADMNFRVSCPSCAALIEHDVLRGQKFRRDVQELLLKDVPMPGTILSTEGRPERALAVDRDSKLFPNRLIKKELLTSILSATDVHRASSGTMNDIRTLIEDALRDRLAMRKVNSSRVGALQRGDKIAIRRMMSHYWANSSPFALDLIGAVIRQGAFIEKMHAIDWIHSPTASATMSRLITKYERYFEILAKYPGKVAVPTLDVDLAWHTHQLSPQNYYTYSVYKTQVFIDHDDKIDELKLSTAFEWTSKTYQKLFSAVYSECTCWYCESVRESHTSTASRLFSSSTKSAEMDLNRLHSSPHDTSNPNTAPHISAHNAIKATIPNRSSHERYKTAQLERSYQKACQRARKNGRTELPARDAYMNTLPYGYPMYMPYYAPYMMYPGMTPGLYASNPGCANYSPGAAGNCCQGSCGGGVAAGACAGAAGGCGGGAAGGCGGGGGGGGGGGCGGGGGG